MASLFLSQFICTLILCLEAAFTTYLLEDDYDLTGDRAAEVVGNLGFVGDIAVVSTEFFIGYMLDLFGRKRMTVGGLLLAGLAMASKPLPNNLIGLYLLKIVSCVAVIPTLYTPYTVDYVQKNSLGLTQGFYSVINTASNMLATSGAIQVQKVFPVSYVYYAVGSLVFCVAILLGFGLKDVHITATP